MVYAGFAMEFSGALTLARIQFAFTVSAHTISSAFSIGLASFLAVGRGVFLDLFNYWKKIFAVAFGMGVVPGIAMSYQFGTNWSVFPDKVGPRRRRGGEQEFHVPVDRLATILGDVVAGQRRRVSLPPAEPATALGRMPGRGGVRGRLRKFRS